VQRASDDVVVERGGRDTAYLYKGEDAGDASGEESSRRWRWSQVTTQQQREEATGPGPPTHVWCQWPEENYVDPGSIRRPMRLYGGLATRGRALNRLPRVVTLAQARGQRLGSKCSTTSS
jgi:hypothetical protein